jgi:hypothetical protein
MRLFSMKSGFSFRRASLILVAIFVVSACQRRVPAAPSLPEVESTPGLTESPVFTNTPTATPTQNPFNLSSVFLRSGTGNTPVTLNFVNDSDETLHLFWVNNVGNEEAFGKIAPQSTLQQGTYNTHAWRVRDAAGNVVTEIVATNVKFQVFEIGFDKKVVYQPTPIPTPTFGPAIQTDERATGDRPDDFPGLYQVHFLYVLPSDSRDLQRDTNGRINKTVLADNKWFEEQSGGSKIRFDTYQGQLDVTYIQLDITSQQVYDSAVALYGSPDFIRDILEAKLIKTNVFQPGKIYVAMFDISKVGHTCADAAHPPELMGRLSGLYTSAVLSDGYHCSDEHFGEGNSYTDLGVIHEVVHLLGFASACGKNHANSDNTSHTGDDNRDLMWAPKDSNSKLFWDTNHMLLDPGNDDYFNNSTAKCPDLSRSVFLDPIPKNAETPPEWPAGWKLP